MTAELIDESGAIVQHEPEPMPLATAPKPMDLLARAIERGVSTESLAAIVDLIHKLDDRAARKAFTAALVAFRAEAPTVTKSRQAEFSGKPAYKFASIDDIEDKIAEPLNRCQLAYTFPEAVGTDNGQLRVTCRLTHIDGHSEQTSIEIPIPKEMRVNATQQGGAAISYGKRYSLCMALGLRIVGEDNDGRMHASPHVATRAIECVTFEQAVELDELIESTGSDKAKFLRWASQQAGREISHTSQLPKGHYPQAVSLLQAKGKK